MDPPREKKRKIIRQKSEDSLSFEQELRRIRHSVTSSERQEITKFLQKLNTDVKFEIHFLQDMLDYHSSKHQYPFKSSEALENFTREWIGLNISNEEMFTRINKLKEKCGKRAEKFYGELFMDADEDVAFELGKKIWGSEINYQIIAARIHTPTPFLSSKVPESVGNILGPVSSSIVVAALHGGVQEEDGDLLGGVLPSDQPRQKEGEADLTKIHPSTSKLLSSMPAGVGSVWREIGVIASHGGLQEEEQIIAPKNPAAIHLSIPLLSSNASEGVDTVLEFVSSGRGSFDGVQEEEDTELQASNAGLFPGKKEVQTNFHGLLNRDEVLPSYQPRRNEGGAENPTTIPPPTSGIETGNEYAANEMGNNTNKESHEEGARIGQD